MSDVRIERLADVLVDYSARVQPGDLVAIEAPAFTAPLVLELHRRVLRAGGHPVMRIQLETAEEQLLREGTDAQLDWVDPCSRDLIEDVDVRLIVYASENTKALSSIDPARQARLTQARQPLQERYLDRAASGQLRWVLSGYPHAAAAQDAAMSLEEYEEFVYAAGFLDHDDPVAEWRRFARELDATKAYLEARSELRIVAEDTDLTLRVGGRTWEAAQGHENFPDGEVFTGPHEDSVEGTIRFTFPAVFNGREVEDVRLRFERGEVVEATAARGASYLREMIAMDEGARRVGEFAFGLNEAVREFTRNILFDEKLGGSVHLALGSGYPETGSKNRSALHWDMICDLRGGSEVHADGELVYRDGRFLPGVISVS